jgi:hypothetical protein
MAKQRKCESREIVFRGMKAVVFERPPKTYPSGYRFYGIRHSEKDWDEPMTIEPTVLVNRWGVIGFREPFSCQELCDGCVFLSEKERDLIRGRP